MLSRKVGNAGEQPHARGRLIANKRLPRWEPLLFEALQAFTSGLVFNLHTNLLSQHDSRPMYNREYRRDLLASH